VEDRYSVTIVPSRLQRANKVFRLSLSCHRSSPLVIILLIVKGGQFQVGY
jgi:hypothetical protein